MRLEYLIILTWLCFCLFALDNLDAQDFTITYNHISIDDGLPHRNITSIIEDRQNLIWFGTQNGLCRYEGHGTTVLTQQNSPLRYDQIDKLYEDKNGLIWVTSNIHNEKFIHFEQNDLVNTIEILDPITLELKSFDEHFKKSNCPVKENDIKLITHTKQGLWLATHDKRYVLYNGTFTLYNSPFFKNYNFTIPKNDTIFYGISDTEISVFSSNTVISKIYAIPPSAFITQLMFDEKKELLLWTRDTINEQNFSLYSTSDVDSLALLYKLIEKKIPPWYFNSHPPKRSLLLDEDLELERKLDSIKVIYKNQNILTKSKYEELQIGIGLKDIYKDRHGNIWIITGNGATVLSLKPNKFKTFFPKNTNKISTRGIIKTDNGDILVNSYSGAMLIDRKTHSISALQYKKDNHEKWLGTSFWQDKDTIIWTGAHGKYVHKINTRDYKIETFQLGNNEALSRIVGTNAIYRDQISNILFFGTEKGLYYYNELIDKVIPYHKDSVLVSLSDSRIFHFIKFKNELWIATDVGLIKFSPEAGIMAHYSFSNQNELPKRIRHVYIDNEGNFWLSTIGDGLLKWHPATNELKEYTSNDGLSNNTVHAVYADESNNLWIPTDHGLNRFNRHTEEFQVFLERDGLPHNEFNWGSHYQDKEGVLYFGGLNGIIQFDPDNAPQVQENNSQICILNLEVLDKKTSQFESKLKEYEANQELSISPNETYLNITYTIDNLISAQNNRYAYKIEGLEKEWNYTQENSLRFGRLPYGKYHLKIKGQGSDGDWTKDEMSVALVIKKPFYLTTPFLITISLGFISLLYVVYKKRTAYLESRNVVLAQQVFIRTQELEEMSRSKDKLFGILAHDLKDPIMSFRNLSEKINYLVRKKEWETLDKMSVQIVGKTAHLENLLNNLIPWATTQIQNPKLHQTNLVINEVISEIVDEYKDLLIFKSLKIRNCIEKNKSVHADYNSLKIIFRNCISNAIKFSPERGNINLSSTSINGYIDIIIEDEGCGIEMSKLTTLFSDYQSTPGTFGEVGIGIGLKLTKDLVLSNGGHLKIENKAGSGVKVIITLLNDSYDHSI